MNPTTILQEYNNPYKEKRVPIIMGKEKVLLTVGLIFVVLLFSIGTVSAMKKENMRAILSRIELEILDIWAAIQELQDAEPLPPPPTPPAECPSDMVQINDYCIDKDINPDAKWWGQVDVCGDEGKRLCQVSEWVYACQENHPDINGMGDTQEFFDSLLNNWNTGEGCSIGVEHKPSDARSARCCLGL